MSDLIKRDDALHIVDTAEDEHPYKIPGLFVTYSEYNQGWSDAVDFIRSRIEKVDSVPAAPRWVRCEERLPEPNTDIVFVAKYCDTYETDIGSMSKDGKWWGYEVWHQNKNVICWMPLPEPPREGE